MTQVCPGAEPSSGREPRPAQECHCRKVKGVLSPLEGAEVPQEGGGGAAGAVTGPPPLRTGYQTGHQDDELEAGPNGGAGPEADQEAGPNGGAGSEADQEAGLNGGAGLEAGQEAGPNGGAGPEADHVGDAPKGDDADVTT